MIKSMTAFAKAGHTQETITAEVIVRSFNSRHLDFNVYLPEVCQAFEEDIKKIITQYHERGRMEIRITVQDDSPEPDQFAVDEAKAAAYFQALQQISTCLHLSDKPGLDHVLGAKNIIVPAPQQLDPQLLWRVVAAAVENAARQLDQMRQKEGANLYQDLAARLDAIENQMRLVEDQAKEIPIIYKKRLEERLERLAPDKEGIDPVRLAQEVAILADKSDVSEEIVRISSHIQQFRDVMKSDRSQGQKLHFLIQEFNREFNTIGSKAGNAQLSHIMVDLKSGLEKIREQVQNIE
ncbi:MAG TPA: YicC/YloC family endoribonuclease [Desulfotignum sp.]|nr:YicC/YloC family endoribonuclease [Desulfotignum sp.]